MRASATLRMWHIGQNTYEERDGLENCFMQLFRELFPHLQIKWSDFNFEYYGNGSFAPKSIQGVMAKTAGNTRIKWTFQIASDGSNQQLQIDYQK